MSTEFGPVLPDYDGANVANVVPEIIKHLMGRETADWLPDAVKQAKQVVLLAFDGLGWETLQSHQHVLPTLAAFEGGAITTTAPSTTTTALTSIMTGRRPNAHGMIGHKIFTNGEVLNALTWRTENGDALERIVPEQFQRQPAFAANRVPVVNRKEFAGSGFTRASLQGAEYVPYSAPSSIPVEVWNRINGGERFVYTYYQFIDTVAHAHGFGEHFEAELYTVDRLIRDLLAGLPEGTALVVTSDHGQVQVGENMVELDHDIAAKCIKFSGEGRFQWLHAWPDVNVDELLALCRERYSHMAWVKTRQEMVDEGWFGGPVETEVWNRMGDVALVVSNDACFRVPSNTDERILECRHGSLTSAEMHVPLLARLV